MQVSVLDELAEIDRFVKWCAAKEEVDGFNMMISKHPNTSYLLAKSDDNPMPLHVHKINLDYADPLQRPLIANAIRKATTGTEMTAQEMEDEMICKVKKDS